MDVNFGALADTFAGDALPLKVARSGWLAVPKPLPGALISVLLASAFGFIRD